MNNNLFSKITHSIPNKSSIFVELTSDEKFSYYDMLSKTGIYANALLKLGAKKGDRVIVQADKSIEIIWLYLASLRLGTIFITLNPSYTLAETEYFIKDSKPVLFLTDKLLLNPKLQKVTSQNGVKKTISLNPSDESNLSQMLDLNQTHFPTALCDGTETAAILYTSGTTGRSKGAMISHNNLFSNAKALSEVWKFSASDKLLHILPIYHTHGLFVALNTVMVSSGSIVFHVKFNEKQVVEKLSEVTVFMGVPTHYIRLLNDKNLSEIQSKNVRLFISGSAPLSAEIHNKFERKTGKAILERYGMTETNMITSNPYFGTRRPGTVGFPLPQVKVRIVNMETGLKVNRGEVGVIEVKGPNVFQGYWNLQKQTEQDFREDGYFITGDLGFFDNQGYLNISGRCKDLIISGGLNVYPAEIEKILDSVFGVQESAIVGLPHPDYGEAVTAFITVEHSFSVRENEIKRNLKDRLASFKVPLKIIQLSSLPKNAMGKVQKIELRKNFSHLYT